MLEILIINIKKLKKAKNIIRNSNNDNKINGNKF